MDGVVGRGSLLVNACDLLILVVGQAFGLEPAENTPASELSRLLELGEMPLVRAS